MGQNLTGQLVSATYEDLVQISGSVLTDGLGNDINNITVTSSFALSSSYAVTASFAENASGVPDALVTASISDATITFTKFNSSSFDITVNNVSSSISASYASQAGTAGFAVNGFPYTGSAEITGSLSVTGSIARQSGSFDGFVIDNLTTPTASEALDHIVVISQADFNAIPSPDANTFYIINDATGSIVVENLVVSGSLQVTGSAGFANGITGSLLGTASFALTASSLVGGVSLQTVLDTGNTATQDIILTGDISATDITGSTVYASSGSFVNLNAVSASFGYVRTVTGSAVIIGDEFIILNADTPTARYAGLIVYDSGSGTPVTASFEWDGLTDNWVVVEESGNSAVVLTGASGSKGTETLPTLNTLVKGGGHHQLIDSNISDSGTLVSINSNTQVTGSLIVSAGITGLISSASLAENANKVYASGSSDPTAYSILLGETGFVGDDFTVVTVDAGQNLAYNPGNSTLYSSTFSGNLTGNATTATSASWSDQAGSSGFATTATSASFASQAGSSGFAISASFAETTSYALNAQPGFPYTGSAEISGSLRVFVDGTADGYTITSGSLSGSLIDNLGTPTGSEAIKHLVYLSQAEYNALTPDSNTMYVISGSGDVVENLVVSGSLEVSGSTILTGSLTVTGTSTLPSITGPTAITGSLLVSGSTTITGSLVGNVSALSISSNTASMDLSGGNFFTLQLVSGSDTYIEPSNIAAGQTINLLVSTTGSATVSFPSTVKQTSGSMYVPTTTTSKDIVTFISFDTGSIYINNVKNLV